ncbi:MAG: sugar phosphate isomerase/epimerase [Smithellaceae bacterium]|nr:sugar phosphate isomerase/epimerase [Smithellaceae bacterium]
MDDVLRRIQVHVPYDYLSGGFLPLIKERRINPEINFSQVVLDQTKREDFISVADELLQTGLSMTFHAPFMDLRPGAVDPRIHQVTIDRLKEVFDLVPYFHPRTVVCHPSFDERYYVSTESLWLERSVETWRYFMTLAEQMDTIITLENTYETEPRQIRALFDEIGDNKRLRFCFDTGHFNCFARSSLQDWMVELGPFLGQLHIHDNNGRTDEHLPIGEGTFPFREFFRMLKESSLTPLITIEAHSEEALWRMLTNLAKERYLNYSAG